MAIKNAPDLTKRPPRSPRVRLGGFVILPRMLDKGRATVAGKHGEYHYNCPMDQRFLNFVGVKADALKVGIVVDLSFMSDDALNNRIYASGKSKNLYAPNYDAFLWDWDVSGTTPTPTRCSHCC